jgi:hypothetical protein
MIKLKSLLESLDSPYKYKHRFSTELVDHEDEETGETYKKTVLYPVQMIHFSTERGVPYLWYARQNRYDPETWEVAFGVDKGKDERGTHSLDIGVTGTGDAARIFATVIDITNSFIEFDEDGYEVQRLMFSSKGSNRTKLYLRLLTKIDKFKLDSVHTSGDETIITLNRND